MPRAGHWDQAGSTGYRILRTAYELGDLGLTPQETAALRVAVGALRMGQTWAEEALWKIDLGDVKTSVPTSVVTTSLPVDPRLPVIHSAISARHHLSFSYGSAKRVLAPFGLLARHGNWYIVGEDQERRAERTFRLDRIEGDIEVLADTSFERPADFDVRASFPSDPKALPGAVDVGSDIAKVRVDASDVGVVVAQYGETALTNTMPDGSGIFDIPCANVEAFVHWLMGFLERAEVLEPVLLRSHVIEWLESAARGGQP